MLKRLILIYADAWNKYWLGSLFLYEDMLVLAQGVEDQVGSWYLF